MNPSISAARWARRAAAAVAASVMLTGMLAACTDNGEDPGDGDLVKVTFLTSFGSLGRDAYSYVALDKGFFEEAGLDVTIEPGTGTNGNSSALVGGTADFAVFDIAGAIIARANGVEGFTTIAVIHQLPPVALMAKDPSITSPADLEGKTVAVAAGTVTEALFPTYMELAGADPSKVNLVPVQASELLNALASGNADAIEQFAMGEPLVEGVVGGDVQVLPYSDHLTDLYGVGLMTTVEKVQQDPDLVARFRDALLRGLQYALDHPQEAAEILAKYVPETNVDVAAKELEIMRAYAIPADGPLGTLDASKLARSIALLQAAGSIPADAAIAPEDLVAFDLVPGAGQ